MIRVKEKYGWKDQDKVILSRTQEIVMEIASNRTALQAAVFDFVIGAEASGSVIDVSATAGGLSRQYPQSGMTIDEICLAIERVAVAAGAVIMAPGQILEPGAARRTPEAR